MGKSRIPTPIYFRPLLSTDHVLNENGSAYLYRQCQYFSVQGNLKTGSSGSCRTGRAGRSNSFHSGMGFLESKRSFHWNIPLSRRVILLPVLFLVPVLPQPLLSLVRRDFMSFSFFTAWHRGLFLNV